MTAVHEAPQHIFSFTLEEIEDFTEFDYELEYQTKTVTQGVIGEEEINGENTRTVAVELGTESDEVFVSHANHHDFELTVTLTEVDGAKTVLSTKR